MKSECHIALFAKFWRPGKVKTRLAVTLGNRVASQVYFQFLSHLLRQLEQAADRRTVVFQPEASRLEFSRLCDGQWELEPQSDGDLGNKLNRFFSRALRRQTVGASEPPNRKVVVIGSDCPRLNHARVEQAFEALDRQKVVVGPSCDGGYYLIGMRNQVLDIFQGISWSTPQVLAETIRRLEKMSVGFELLPEMSDVDEIEDLQALMRELSEETDQADRELLERLTKITSSSGDSIDQVEIQP